MAHDELLDALPAVAGRAPRPRRRVDPRAARHVLAGARAAARGRRRRRAVRGLFLAGDWIDTGLPATIESAVGAATGGAIGIGNGHRIAMRCNHDYRYSIPIMNSIVVHYKELALKGRNRPWFVQLLVRNLRTALARARRRRGALGHGPHRDRARRRTRRRRRGARTRLRRGVRHRQLLVRGPRAARLRRAGGGDPRAISAIARAASFRVSAPAAPTSGFRSRRRRSSARSAA